MRLSRTVLLTGATGFLGTMLALRLLKEDVNVLALVRAKDHAAAELRLKKAWWDWPELSGSVGTRIKAVLGDIGSPSSGLSAEDHETIVSSVDVIINAAADLRLNEDIEVLRRTNVSGVGQLLQLAKEVEHRKGLLRFSHVSTAYVCGKGRGEVKEGDIGTVFSSNYERSKAEGELLVRDSGLPSFSIFRPAMVVGETSRGWIRTFNTLYYPLRLYLTGRLRCMPIDPDTKVNMVPGDVAAEAIVRLTLDERASGRTVNLVMPPEQLPTMRQLTDMARVFGKNELNVELPRAVFMKLPGAVRDALVRTSGTIARSRGAEGDLTPLLAYMEQGQSFRRDALDELFAPQKYDWREHMLRCVSFAARYGFMHRSERTVHEQLLFRLERKRRRTRLFDIYEGERHERDASATARDIVRAARALISLGVRKGDRVAVVGLNSVRFLTVEGGIGLAGAVSVPLYYTSPIGEIEHILADCEAKVLFVGSPKFAQIAKGLPGVRCVNFCRKEGAECALGWEEFLRMGDNDVELPGVGFDDMATIRYTSGTTGRPQGVVFDHGNLRWMAEAIACLPPWTARNQEVSYLSFLPMNHVVEGVLGTYSPYYAPAPLRLHFLEEFKSLREALPMVHPNVFFSVPRFYEKLWDAFLASSLWKLYDLLPDRRNGKARRTIGKLLLKKAGLDRCSHLIVGSAPCSDELLNDLRSIGIEVHNAYGLTEAPLITLNRVGRNRIGTVGEPLPETEISISDDGEIMVRGRQVMRGYYPLSSENDAGPLRTGDLGRMDEMGHLVIEGRKKEVMINAYGKNIMPVKIESMARQIPGVADAMLIVEGRQYATMVLWAEEGKEGMPGRQWDEEMRKMGTSLSDPERPKAWAVVANDLDIEKGEMTANLKLKRKVLLKKYEDIIQAFYSNGPVPKGVIHLGREEKG